MIKSNLTIKQFNEYLSTPLKIHGLPLISQKIIKQKLEIILQQNEKELLYLLEGLREGSYPSNSGYFHAIIYLYQNKKILFKNTTAESNFIFEQLKSLLNPINLAIAILSILAGFLLFTNQVGFLIDRIDIINISILSPIWKFSILSHILGFKSLIVIFILLILLHYVVFLSHGDFAISFRQGLLSGFFLIPILTCLLILIYLTLAVIVLIIKFFFLFCLWIVLSIFIPVISFILLPFVWSYEHILYPIFSFIYTLYKFIYNYIVTPIYYVVSLPFIWIYEYILYPFLSFILFPFIWLYNNIIFPLLSYIYALFVLLIQKIAIFLNFIVPYLKTIFFITVLSILGICNSLLFWTIGGVMIKTIADTFRARLNTITVFSYGIGLGFILFDIIFNFIVASITASPYINPSPIFVLFIILSSIFLTRFILSDKEIADYMLPYKQKAFIYIEKSTLDIAVSVFLIPVIPLFYMAVSEEEG